MDPTANLDPKARDGADTGVRTDNMGMHKELVSEETIRNVVKVYPRLGWSKCFAATIREENGLKPWCHTTALGEEEFPNGVLGNELMNKYE